MRILFILALLLGLFIPSVAAQSCDDISFTAPTLEEIESCVPTKHTIRLLKKGRIAVCPLNTNSLSFNACMDAYDVAIEAISSRVVMPKPITIAPVVNKSAVTAVLWVLFCMWGFLFTSKKERQMQCATIIEGTFARFLSDEEYMEVIQGDLTDMVGMSMEEAETDCSLVEVGKCFYINNSPNTYNMGGVRRTMDIRKRMR
tara:strand:+ start:1247 stop:1849 length:603 start_codon:yes stop_codon:yes gene_type:complete